MVRNEILRFLPSKLFRREFQGFSHSKLVRNRIMRVFLWFRMEFWGFSLPRNRQNSSWIHGSFKKHHFLSIQLLAMVQHPPPPAPVYMKKVAFTRLFSLLSSFILIGQLPEQYNNTGNQGCCPLWLVSYLRRRPVCLYHKIHGNPLLVDAKTLKQ